MEELKAALLLNNTLIEKNITSQIEHLLDMQSVGGDGYCLPQQRDCKINQLVERVYLLLCTQHTT